MLLLLLLHNASGGTSGCGTSPTLCCDVPGPLCSHKWKLVGAMELEPEFSLRGGGRGAGGGAPQETLRFCD